MAIYDCFPFFNELDIVEIRFKELYDVVDKFILCESYLTHSGKPKPLYFAENKERFAPFADKIIHLASDAPKTPEVLPGTDHWADMNWTRERFQRNYIFNKLAEICNDDDIIIISDADEIFCSDNINELNNIDPNKLYSLNMSPSWYYLNLVCDDKWGMGKALTFGALKKKHGNNLSSVRNSGFEGVIEGGWHLGYMGGFERVKLKLQSFAHAELDVPEIVNDNHIKNIVRFGTAPWDKFEETAPRGSVPFWKYIKLETSTLPACVKRGEYNHLVSNAYFSRYDYDCGNLYHILNLCKQVTTEGDVIDVGCGEGRASFFLANAFPDDVVHCLDEKVEEQFYKNMDFLTDGNFELHEIDALSFVKARSKIKAFHINADFEFEYFTELLKAVNDKITGLICGYNWQVDNVQQAVSSVLGDVSSSGNFWFKQKG